MVVVVVVVVPIALLADGVFDPVPVAVGLPPDPDVVLPVVVVTDGDVVVVVVVSDDNVVGEGATSVEALQISAYEGATDGDGGGFPGLSDPFVWYLKPTTSSGGLATGCSVGPSLAYTHVPEAPCQYDQ